MQQLFSIFIFYKPYILWSFAMNVLFSFMKIEPIIIIITKLFLVGFLWYFINETTARRKLILYKNLGISTFKLFAFIYLIDLLLSLPLLIILNEFV